MSDLDALLAKINKLNEKPENTVGQTVEGASNFNFYINLAVGICFVIFLGVLILILVGKYKGKDKDGKSDPTDRVEVDGVKANGGGNEGNDTVNPYNDNVDIKERVLALTVPNPNNTHMDREMKLMKHTSPLIGTVKSNPVSPPEFKRVPVIKYMDEAGRVIPIEDIQKGLFSVVQ